MNKYMRWGLFGIGAGIVVTLISFIIASFLIIPNFSQDCIECSQGIIMDLTWAIGLFLAWPFEIFYSLFINIPLTLVYWFVFGIVIGFFTEKITNFLKNKKQV